MREFTSTLKTIMSVVSNQLELLPASEGAVEVSTMEFEIVHEFRTKVHDHWMIKDGLVSFGKYGGGNGPESAHVNISGISGLATKTSHAMFLLQSILQKIDPSQVAVIIMNGHVVLQRQNNGALLPDLSCNCPFTNSKEYL
jgi:hypothetical protein